MEEEIDGHASVTTRPRLRRKTRPAVGDQQYGRSSVTNGGRMYLDPAAGDTAWSRRGRDIYNLIIRDLGTDIDEAQLQQVRRCAMLALECERFECQIAAGNAVDLATYALLGDTYARAAQCLYDLKGNK
jgi:hypothetical protein